MARNGNDHGGGLDAAIAQYGGARSDWIDLSTGINPQPYPLPAFTAYDWAALPDQATDDAACAAARRFWNVPDGAAVLATAGCSAPIVQIAGLLPPQSADIALRSYNEHAASFAHFGWDITPNKADAAARVVVNPNNPTGAFTAYIPPADLTVIDESFCDIAPEQSLIHLAGHRGHLVLKGFGKFWGLAGLRLGFVIGDRDYISVLKTRLGPWPVSGPALRIAATALQDEEWAVQTRITLAQNAARLDALLAPIGERPMGQVSLFRTYEVAQARALYERLAQAHILTRIFPYADNWIRFGLPLEKDWGRVQAAL